MVQPEREDLLRHVRRRRLGIVEHAPPVSSDGTGVEPQRGAVQDGVAPAVVFDGRRVAQDMVPGGEGPGFAVGLDPHRAAQPALVDRRRHRVRARAHDVGAEADHRVAREEPCLVGAHTVAHIVEHCGAVRAVGDAPDEVPRHRRGPVLRRRKLGARDPGQLAPVPDREDVLILVAFPVEIQRAVGGVIPGEILAVHQLGADHPGRRHFQRRRKNGLPMDQVIRPPEKPVAHQVVRCAGSVAGNVGAVGRSLGRIKTGRLRHHLGDGGGLGPRRMRHELPGARAGIHGSTPRNPVLALDQVAAKRGEFPRWQLPRRAAQDGAPPRGLDGERHPVVAKLQLGAVLVEAEVRLEALCGRDLHLAPDRIGGGADRRLVAGEHAAHERDAGQPDPVLTGAPDRVPRQRRASGVTQLGLLQFLAEEQCRHADRFRNADLVVPPIRTLEIVGDPIPKRPVGGRQQDRAVGGRSAGLVGGSGHCDHPRAVVLGGPAGARLRSIVEVRPPTVRCQRLLQVARFVGIGGWLVGVAHGEGVVAPQVEIAELPGDLLDRGRTPG